MFCFVFYTPIFDEKSGVEFLKRGEEFVILLLYTHREEKELGKDKKEKQRRHKS